MLNSVSLLQAWYVILGSKKRQEFDEQKGILRKIGFE